MKRILFVNGHLNTGGVERALADVLRHMDYSKYAVDLLLLEDTGDYAAELPPEVEVPEDEVFSLATSLSGVPA